MSETVVLTEKKGAVFTITLNRPEKYNALDQEVIRELQAAVDKAGADEDIKVVVLTGANGNFCSGADMALFQAGLESPVWLDGMRRLGRLVVALRSMDPIVVTKLHGAAIGGGANLALAGDFVVAADNAKFRENFVEIGLVLDAGGTYFLPRLVGLVKARELALLAEEISGRQGADMGLFYKSVPLDELDGEVEKLVQTLVQKPKTALALIKEGLENSLDMSLKQLMDRESGYQAVVLQTQEHRDRVNFFLEARGKK
jgi:2-(1,2-epoxy-1,2-dihydrophenyl)acetyl-CoA isomerase